jgi:hypothetical protein
MTATELQRIANRLANQAWCRYWLNFHNSHENVVMAIQIIDSVADESGKFKTAPVKCADLERLGFKIAPAYDHIYFVPRTNKDGTSYTSSLLF